MTVEEMTYRWAEQKYGLENVVRVDFDLSEGYGGGCETCGYGSHPPVIDVFVVTGDGRAHTYEERYAGDLINSILAFKSA